LIYEKGKDMKLKKRKLIFTVVFICLILCSVCIFVVFASPVRNCFDPLSGKVPDNAIEMFIDLVITATLQEDYDLLKSISSDEAFNQLVSYEDNFPFISTDYTIKQTEDFAGTYSYRVFFPEGSIHLSLVAQWTQCPDFRVTEEEVLQNIKLFYVK
jgi:hypothetical protein